MNIVKTTVVALFSLVAAVGCGDDAADADGSGGAASAGTSAGGSAGTGRAGSANGGRGGTAPVTANCSGEFGAPQIVLQGTAEHRPSSLNVSADELELVYVAFGAGPEERFMVSRRSSVDEQFPLGTEIPELNAFCAFDQRKTIDLTHDGLRAYVGCGGFDGEPQPLYFAQRPSRTAAFVVDDDPVATTAGQSACVDSSELVAFTSGVSRPSPPMILTRESRDDRFTGAMPIPGLEDATTFITPELTRDGLHLFGAVHPAIVMASRTSVDAPFAAPQAVITAQTANEQLGSAEVTESCRKLYFVRAPAGMPWTVEVIRR